MLFQQGNIGKWEIFHFGVLEDQMDFYFYTDQDTLHFQFENSTQYRKYLINSDTLIMTSPIPDSLKYLDSKHFTTRLLKAY
jgi:hypothetical protein